MKNEEISSIHEEVSSWLLNSAKEKPTETECLFANRILALVSEIHKMELKVSNAKSLGLIMSRTQNSIYRARYMNRKLSKQVHFLDKCVEQLMPLSDKFTSREDLEAFVANNLQDAQKDEYPKWQYVARDLSDKRDARKAGKERAQAQSKA